VQRFVGVLQHGPPSAAGPTLLLLRCVLEVPHVRLGPAAAYPPLLFLPLTAALEGRHSAAALQVRQPAQRASQWCSDTGSTTVDKGATALQ
jgi:hypothetical protein